MKKENINDILETLCALSNNEILTPPDIARQMLDILPQDVFKSTTTKFLDPVSKSGVFLREITIRLLRGQKEILGDKKFDKEFDNILDNILKNQVYGIATSKISWYLTRRTLYTSLVNDKYKQQKDANGNEYIEGIDADDYYKYNNIKLLVEQFTNEFDVAEIENKLKEFNMKFDVIIGNPPYQMSDGGFGASATAIYNLFVEQAIKLEPKYLSMIIPSRWFSGGRGLDNFRKLMLNDTRVRVLHDFLDSSECFESVGIAGGVCYFLWDRDNRGKCNVFTHINNNTTNSERDLLEKGQDTFIRYNEGIPVLKKVLGFDCGGGRIASNRLVS